MTISNELRDQIKMDLKIFPFENEVENDYTNRLIFSAIGKWFLYISHDCDLNDNQLYKISGVSKKYITKRCKEILNGFISIYPTFVNFIQVENKTNEESKNDFIRRIRGCFEQVGYYLPGTTTEYLTLALPRTFQIDKNWALIRNNFELKNTRVVGLGTFSNDGVCEDLEKINQIFYLPKITALEWTQQYIEQLDWRDAGTLGENTLYFNMNLNSSNYKCWDDTFPKESEVTLYKTNNFDYGFAKKGNQRIIGIKIPDYLIGNSNNQSENLFNKDVRRFMYGLRSMFDNSAKAKIKEHKNFSEVILYNKLPERENIALKFFSWQKHYKNELIYKVPNDFIGHVKEILENVSIATEEK